MQFNFRTARISDITNLVDLINSAYRQTQELQANVKIANPGEGHRWAGGDDGGATVVDGKLFVAELDGQIVACIGLTFTQHDVEIGTFCIASTLQNQGIGKYVLDFVEQYVHNKVLSNHCHFTHFVMWGKSQTNTCDNLLIQFSNK
jgi:N-acetylglutamate synthase-like GNAT family acetyltransferase